MKIPGHAKPEAATHCALCFAYHSDPRYRALIDGKAAARPGHQVPAAVPCKFRGENIFALELVRAGLDPQREHFRCGLGLGVGGIVCSCRECRPTCGGYVASCVPE